MQRGFTMNAKNYWHAMICTVLAIPLVVFAQTDPAALESSWLELVKGYKGDALGAELVEIEDGDVEGTQKITLAIPKKSMSHPDAIEEVVVIGRRPEKRKPLDISYEWLDDYDKDNYGLVIRLGKNTNWPIRLYMNSDAGFTR
jgi:hypothetical protein